MNHRARLVSVDALRGITVAAMLLVNDAGDWSHVYGPLEHAPWNGATPTDLIFPFFLFLVGVSTALGVVPHVEAGEDRAKLGRNVLLRALRIILLGLFLHVLTYWLTDTPFRPFGVLQRIGICFAAAGMLAIHTKPRMQWIVIWGLLFGYWALMAWSGPLTREGNLESRLDTWLLGPHAYVFNPVTGIAFDPEGLLSTLPAIATTLIGLRAGSWLRGGDIQRLWSLGTYAILFGFVWSIYFPVNKNLWTSSYALWTSGWVMLALALFHELMDKRKFSPIGRRFGVNAIAAYAGAWIMSTLLEGTHLDKAIYARGFSWMIPHAGAEAASLAYAAVFVAFWWLIVTVLDRRKIHIRI
jgi:predicted acyltransferase